MQAIKFNTGRHYAPEGQVIIAWMHTLEVIRFHDTTRCVKGQIVGNADKLNERFVIQQYDSGNYAGDWFDDRASELAIADSQL